MIDKEHQLPITKQCHIVRISRSSVYYEPVSVSDNDRALMRLIDEIHLEDPSLGSRGIKGAGPQGRENPRPDPHAENGH
jgi:putative transposase